MPRFPRLSPSSQGLSNQVFGDLVRRAHQRSGPLYPLHVGDTWLEPVESVQRELQRKDHPPGLYRYAPVQGEPCLLDAIEDHLQERSGIEIDRECLQVVCGATSGLNIVCTTLLDEGDEVIILAPFWPLIRGIVHSLGAKPVELPLVDRFDREGFDVGSALRSVITERTVAIYVNTPHNPTGRVLPRELLDTLAEVALEHDLWILDDEVYDDLWYTAQAPAPLWTHPRLRERTIACHSLSKSYGLAGARVGFVHGPAEFMQSLRGVQTFLTYCAPRPMQFAACAALREGQEWLAKARQAYRDAGHRAAATLGLPPPAGGTFLFFDVSAWLPEGAGDARLFLEACLEEGVLLTPGAACGRDYARWVRLCFSVIPPKELNEAVERVAAVLARGPR